MINPSANGWIAKFLQQNATNFPLHQTPEQLYFDIQKTGFIYGHVVQLNTITPINTAPWSTDELTKVALLSTLYQTYQLHQPQGHDFVPQTVAFYKEIVPNQSLFFKNWFTPETPLDKLEHIINGRIQPNTHPIAKNFSHILTNALLFIDIIAFEYYLENQQIPKGFMKNIEENCLYIVSQALQIKPEKTAYDDLLVKLFKNSLRYTSFEQSNSPSFNWKPYQLPLEKLYYLDLAEMALWNDGVMEPQEDQFMKNLAQNLSVDIELFKQSHSNINQFIAQYKNQIPYFQFSNPVQHFYEQTNRNVTRLILRNKKRLVQEISESKELAVLLGQSTQRSLTQEEKKKVKQQLLDICKSIPSLAIFLLPGGGLLLPLLIKFIPELLPSSFNENRN